MDLQTAFFYPKQDPEWVKKTLTLFLCYLFILTIPAAAGYQIRAARMAANGQNVLPDWDDFIGLYVEGLRLWLSNMAINTIISAMIMLIVAILFIVPFLGAIVIEFAGTFDKEIISVINNLLSASFSFTQIGIQCLIATFTQIFVFTSLAEFNTWQAPFEIDRFKFFFKGRFGDAFKLLTMQILVTLCAILLIVLTLLAGSVFIIPYAALVQSALAGQFIQEGKKEPDFV